MAKMKPKAHSADQVLLGEKLFELRARTDITRKQLGKRVKVTEQQIKRYEEGAFVPMAMLERLCEELGEPIQKKYIRRISALRERIKDDPELTQELYDLYEDVFSDD